MADRVVVQSDKDQDGDITALCNPNASESLCRRQDSIELSLDLAKDAPDLSINIEEELSRAAGLIRLLQTVTSRMSSIGTEATEQARS